MGSGSSGPYGKSQPYASTYHVEKSMPAADAAFNKLPSNLFKRMRGN